MLREVKNAGIERRFTVLGWRWYLVQSGKHCGAEWRTAAQRALQASQEDVPVPLFVRGDRTYWWFEDRFYWEDEGIAAHDVLALVRERQRRQRRTLERAHAALAVESAGAAAGGGSRRAPIPREVRLAVWQRDGGRCVDCGSGFELQYDHVIPVALGGASTVENLQVLCAPCNQRKGASVA